jgi:hypothetical protein
MPPKEAGRRRHGRTFREGTARGRRYVENGRVRIEWREHGRRRRKTIGPDSADTRRRADAVLQDTLRGLSETDPAEPRGRRSDATANTPSAALRALVIATLDTADAIADWIATAIDAKEVP